MKKIYSKPEILVVESQIECSILAGSSRNELQSLGQSRTQTGSEWVVGGKVANESESDGHSVFGKRSGDLWE